MNRFAVQSLKRLAHLGISRAEAERLGGATSAGGNVTFTEDTPGFARVEKLTGVKVPIVKQGISTEEWKREKAPGVWREFHEATYNAGDTTEKAVNAILARTRSQTPCGECKMHWDTMVKRTPSPHDCAAIELGDWGVDRHNEVRVMQGKTPMSHDESRALYRR